MYCPFHLGNHVKTQWKIYYFVLWDSQQSTSLRQNQFGAASGDVANLLSSRKSRIQLGGLRETPRVAWCLVVKKLGFYQKWQVFSNLRPYLKIEWHVFSIPHPLVYASFVSHVICSILQLKRPSLARFEGLPVHLGDSCESCTKIQCESIPRIYLQWTRNQQATLGQPPDWTCILPPNSSTESDGLTPLQTHVWIQKMFG